MSSSTPSSSAGDSKRNGEIGSEEATGKCLPVALFFSLHPLRGNDHFSLTRRDLVSWRNIVVILSGHGRQVAQFLAFHLHFGASLLVFDRAFDLVRGHAADGSCLITAGHGNLRAFD